MKRNLFLTALLLAVAAFANAQTTKTYDFKNFSGLELGGSFRVYITEATEYKIELKGNTEDLEKLEVEVRGSTLSIRPKRQGMGWESYRGDPIDVRIAAPAIERVDISGSCTITSENTLTPDAFDLSLSGSGKVSLALQTGHCELSMSGSGEIELSGKALDLEVDISGSGDVRTFGLVSEKARIETSGSADVEVFASKELVVQSSGSSQISYKGAPPVVEISSSGSSRVRSAQ